MVQLDALRAFAVTAVMFHHFCFGGPWGHWGVHLFFVLSGFLITDILLFSREKQEAKPSAGWFPLRQFYFRRLLRIVPLAWLAVTAAILFNVPYARSQAGWLYGFSANFYMVLHNDWMASFSHFWSLAVEQQFYVIWPLLILFVPSRWLMSAVLAMVLTGPAFRAVALLLNMGEMAAQIMTPACCDSLGIGALVALGQCWWPGQLLRWARRSAILGLVAWIVLSVLWNTTLGKPICEVLKPSSEALVFGWFVASASQGFGGRMGKLLERKWLLYAGKISYGIYVYHKFMPGLIGSTFLLLDLSCPTVLARLLAFPVTLVIAGLSWKFFEEPINRLKRYFPY